MRRVRSGQVAEAKKGKEEELMDLMRLLEIVEGQRGGSRHV